MKIIEAMKKLKDLQRKCHDLRNKVAVHCAGLSYETPPYGLEQRKTVEGWVQSHRDIVQEIARLRVAIQKTNILTLVTIDFGDKSVTKTIAEWIHRRRDLAQMDASMVAQLGDRGLKEQRGKDSQGNDVEIKIVRYFDPKVRDELLNEFQSEPSIIDGRLEVVNAITDLVE